MLKEKNQFYEEQIILLYKKLNESDKMNKEMEF